MMTILELTVRLDIERGVYVVAAGQRVIFESPNVEVVHSWLGSRGYKLVYRYSGIEGYYVKSEGEFRAGTGA